MLFIDGPRGAGKTSLLLTLLKRWRNEEEGSSAPLKHLRVLLPILDFDPLPRAMPLHGWLLEPWRKEAARIEKDCTLRGGSGEDLSELWAEVFERAVIGWTQASVEGKGVAEKALAYQEQASGWIDTTSLWHKFVYAAICRLAGCQRDDCKEAHPCMFVIAIDDVDLQVEHVPQLIHAIRLFHHPQVAYVLTGNYDHLRFALKLDYMVRHQSGGRTHGHGDQHVDEEIRKEIRIHSDQLCDAFIEKALPPHSMLTLESWSLQEVMPLRLDSNASSKAEISSKEQTVGGFLGDEWKKIAETAGSLRITTVRRVQHAIDRHDERRTNSNERQEAEILNLFAADLCGTSIEGNGAASKPVQVTLRGELSTRLGAILRVWEGHNLKIFLMDQPSIAFFPDFSEAANSQEEAHRALIVQLAVEKGQFGARALDWIPDAGILATEVQWDSKQAEVDGTAIFHWPWLQRPKASEALQLGEVAKALSKAEIGNSRTDLQEEFIKPWISENIKWFCTNREKPLAEPNINLKNLAQKLSDLPRDNNKEDEAEIKRWIGELFVMTAPYFGLPELLCQRLRDSLNECKHMPSIQEIHEEEKRIVKNAIINWQMGITHIGRQPSEKKRDPPPEAISKAVDDFLKVREKLSNNDSWWKFTKSGLSSQAAGQKRSGPRKTSASKKAATKQSGKTKRSRS
ncbi:hypothetical protein [Chondromyces apiculatus]|uniref:hypothetical protein n=1 Tax=Chondromyces apiculatus TaxID=51 RepID=UPI001E385DF0|nr:hypothetical protein [Chondromyces apiculatus]